MSWFKKRNRFFALTFSDQTIVLAQTTRKGEVLVSAVFNLEPGIIERGWLKNPAALKEALSKFLPAQKIKGRFVAVGLSETTAFSHVLTLPNLPPAEFSDAVRWQAEPLLPMGLDEAYLDWQLLEKRETGTEVLVMALPMRLVEDYAVVLEELGYRLSAFEPTSLSLARLVKKSDTASLAVELREKEAVLVVVGPRGEIELSSTVKLGEKTDRQEIFATVKEVLTFYERKKGEAGPKIGQVWLCGHLNGLETSFEKEVNLPAKPVEVKPLELATTISLARKNVAAPQDERTINLIPPRIQKIYDLAEKSATLGSWVKAWSFGLFLVLFAFGVVTAQVYFDSKKVEGELIERQVLASPASKQVEEAARTVTAQADQVLELAGHQVDLISLLPEVDRTASAGAVIDHYVLNFEKNELLLDGLADSQDQLLAFKENLEKSGLFSQVRIPLSSLEREENVRFTLSLVGQAKD